MQFLIDTATDSPAELYRIGKFLVSNYETVAAPVGTQAPAVNEAQVPGNILPPPPPPPPVPVATHAEDTEIETDDEPAALTVSVQLQPSAPPPVPPPPGPAVAAEVDSAGVPWDSRIHASNRSKKIDGTWKNKRGLDPAVKSAVQAVAVAPFPLAAPPPPAPAAPAAVTLPAAPVTAPALTPAPVDFRGLMQKITAATAAGKLTHEAVNAALATVGLKPEDMGQLIGNALYIASVNAAIEEMIK